MILLQSLNSIVDVASSLRKSFSYGILSCISLTYRYDSQETLALMDGVVDIYMPDMKYADSGLGKRYSHVKNYPAVNQTAVKEMHRQVGHMETIALCLITLFPKDNKLHFMWFYSESI